jgi:hypothetical protein
MITNERFIRWMNVVRNTQGQEQYRVLESFWESQITSKQWLIDVVTQQNILSCGPVYIFGGWFGVLAGMLKDVTKYTDRIYSIDIDPDAQRIGTLMNPDIHFITCDMADFSFPETPSLVINTSTEHITQEVFDGWRSKIPKFTTIVLQGNNFFSCNEHVRCSHDLHEFEMMNPLSSIQYEGELDCTQFTRYMIIGH